MGEQAELQSVPANYQTGNHFQVWAEQGEGLQKFKCAGLMGISENSMLGLFS